MKLYYVHDPMCSWCWAFRPVWQQILANIPHDIRVERVLGGLAADTDEPMPEETRQYVISNWRKIQSILPEIEFNYDFWQIAKPRRSTYPACRAVIAAKNLDPSYEEPMILAIQQAYYLQARNPSDQTTLCELATEIGLDGDQFHAGITGPNVQEELLRQITMSQRIGAGGFPSLTLELNGQFQRIPHDYKDSLITLDALAALIGNFQITDQ